MEREHRKVYHCMVVQPMRSQIPLCLKSYKKVHATIIFKKQNITLRRARDYTPLLTILKKKEILVSSYDLVFNFFAKISCKLLLRVSMLVFFKQGFGSLNFVGTMEISVF